jgi:hypothetical protein
MQVSIDLKLSQLLHVGDISWDVTPCRVVEATILEGLAACIISVD